MSVETSLNYQQNFYDQFATAWRDQSTYRIYQGLDNTASNLRLDPHDVPGYILAYDKNAEQELVKFLQAGLVAWLRQHVPFFDVTDDGRVFFGDWYHRRQFGHLDVISRTILHQTDDQRAIMPQLYDFADHQATYLDDQIEDLRRDVYQEATDLHNQLETMEADEAGDSEAATTGRAANNSSNNGSGLRGLLRNFIDPDDDDDESAAAKPAPSRPQPQHRGNGLDVNRIRHQFDQAKEAADKEFDSRKRQLQVAAAVTNYEYQALTKQYDTVADFANVLTNMPDDYMHALKAEEGGTENA